MTITEVREKIGDNRLDEFLYFMIGQTYGMTEDGEVDYYECDVENFLRRPKDRFFD